MVSPLGLAVMFLGVHFLSRQGVELFQFPIFSLVLSRAAILAKLGTKHPYTMHKPEEYFCYITVIGSSKSFTASLI